MENEPIRILNIVPNMRAAGIETFIMNVYRNIDRNKVQFDFLVHNQKEEFYDKEINNLGGRIYRLTYKDDKNIFKYIKDLNNFFKEHKEYKIVHGHMQSMMPLYLCIAKKNKVPVRIAHSHNGSYEKTIKGYILHVFSRFSKYFSTCNWACSKVAGKYLFGKKKFEIVYNGIDTNKFQFNPKIRKNKRNELNIKESEFVIGHIGRFELQKNHKFIIKLLNELYKDNKNIKLLLIGIGKYKNDMEKKVKELNLEKNIVFLGTRNDVDELYQAMDCFILPSLYEGLPLVGVEAQINNLYCLFSNTITKELKISEKSYYLNINNLNEWKNKISEIQLLDRQKLYEINVKKFDITEISKKIQERYIKYGKK